ncbi:carcinoembryonic antigen-related cell adhesion molecule 2 isoform b precursor [Mus musculus]|uniref:Isoform 2 of Cell adhesion molecule CEACAM2 n=2 Tax=Mus musculus TaxID=10090 RepID=Q925P2-2|nr:carcinoembryonic antigen-related cell adhesion molecule 2 isoform b precursor [Mus musculus]BAM29120.1 carcinoembryonic antigen-related cell adhesion molecule 2- Long [Mus musculus]|eukprot:NP_001106840.1 carcinoembryonic antigen-related cell adhesion molecule 2 isoform b precursor [Mus musculus]
MELASAHLHKGQVPWFGLLLTASLLASWSPPTTAQVTVMAFPLHAAEGNNVILVVYNMMKGVSAFSWHKGSTTSTNAEIVRFVTGTNKTIKGPVHSGRETLYSNGSLLIQRVTMKDTGVYTIEMTDQNYRRRVLTGQFHVHKPVTQPSLQVTNTTVKELDSVTLTCLSKDRQAHIHWIFNNDTLLITEKMTTSQAGLILKIDPIKREDAGEYQCEISNPVSVKRSNSIKLEVIFDSTYDISDVPIAVIITGAVAGVILIAGLAYRLCSRKSRWGSDQRDLTEHKPSASNHNLAPSDNSPNKVDDVAYTVLNFNSQQPNRPTSAPSSPRATETVYSEVKKK